jgi:NitT/TauT family transport system substrate-binding protein
MVGIALHADLLDQSPELVAALRTGLAASRDRVLADPARAAKLAERTMDMRAPVFEKAFPHFHIEAVSAKSAKEDLVEFYSTILDLEPESLGGKLPGDDFYLDL